jgi:hypothetical protein
VRIRQTVSRALNEKGLPSSAARRRLIWRRRRVCSSAPDKAAMTSLLIIHDSGGSHGIPLGGGQGACLFAAEMALHSFGLLAAADGVIAAISAARW